MKIVLIRLRLLLLEPGGVSAPELATDDLDLPLAFDRCRNLPVLPPTSLAGAMRRIPGIDPDAVFGYERGETGQASAVRVLGTAVTTPAVRTPRRVRTAMDRHRRAPRPHALFSSEVLPVGTTIEAFLRWDDPEPDQLAALLKALPGWRPLVGRGVTVGQGRARVCALGSREIDLADDADLLHWLTVPGPEQFSKIPMSDSNDHPDQEHWIDVRWRIADALHVGGGEPEPDHDGPMVARVLRDGETFVVPGSTWKGVLRSRCEYILRSLDVPACEEATCGICPTCQLFGHASPVGGARGTVRFLGCAAETDPDHGLTAAAAQERQHVAIDRFTGGAHDSLLFTQEVVTSGTLRLRVETHHNGPPHWARGLLLMAVADIADGLVGLGGSTTRGCGTLQRIDNAGRVMPTVLMESEWDEARDALAELRARPHPAEEHSA
ncbi:MAG: hypothetical protein H0V92_11215 [Pseudonocardiales bacterium]|nr:hypothetical protein [Pseudonocardiales bacterium]